MLSFAPLLLAALAWASPAGRVEGRVWVSGGDGWDLSRAAVFLVPRDGRPLEREPGPPARLSQRNARFAPEFAVIEAGQTVEFPNDDDIAHNVFSFSDARRFDLGLYPRGASKSVRFDATGPVFLFCSVHEWMSAVIYVAPNRLHAVTDARGRFAIAPVPAGRYMAYTWHASLPHARRPVEVREVEVAAGAPTRVDIDLSQALGEAP